MNKLPILAIVGPTAVGKTDLSLALGETLPLEIVSVDSRLVYRGMDIGTAKPTLTQRAHIKHHLIDVVEPTEEFGLAEYLELAHDAIQGVYRRGRVPLLVGGSGQYLWALLESWQIPAVPPDKQLRRNLYSVAEVEGVHFLHHQLVQVDPDSAGRIDARNVRRVVRALEIYHQAGIQASQLRKRGDSKFHTCIVGLTLAREELYSRIDQRVHNMLEQGWIDEVRNLLERGVPRFKPAMSSVGYGDLAAYIQGELSLAEAIRNTKGTTRRLVRHQFAWFRFSDARIHWLQSNNEAKDAARVLAEAHLQP